MLRAFPPPGRVTPQNDARHLSVWPEVDLSDARDLDEKPRKGGKRCCGMPCWLAFVLMLLGLALIAAAVVVPLEILVIHKPKAAVAPPSALSECQLNSATACQNGGTSTLSTNSCECICINGFTGTTCMTAGASGCTTTELLTDTGLGNVTLGNSIPRLITAAQTNFSIPLTANVILARFNSASLSCISENALVTFDGQAIREGSSNAVVVPTTTLAPAKRQATSTSISGSAVATSNGILYDPDSVNGPVATASAPASSSPSATPTAGPYAVFSVTEEVLDFARVTVLYILQQESLDDAVDAQTSLQSFFSVDSFTNRAAQNVSLGNGNSADLIDLIVNLGVKAPVAVNSTSARKERRGRGMGVLTG